MTERDALKLALEALLWANKEINGWMDDAQGLDPVDHPEIMSAVFAIKEALAQPEQEPVTWRNAAIRVGEDLCSVGPFGYYDMTAEQWLDWALSVVTVHAPPQRTWVGLTADELSMIGDRMRTWNSHSLADVYVAIEAKLKEKNT